MSSYPAFPSQTLTANVTTGTAAIFHHANEPLTLETHPLPELRPGEILVRVACTTICASDLHTFRGRRGGPCPCVLGHEITGTIAAFGPDAPRVDIAGMPLAQGQRVTWTVAGSCGECFYCRRGLPQKCETLFKYGHTSLEAGRVFSGGYAEYCVLVRGTGVLRLPDSLCDTLAATANCTASTVAAVFRLLAQTLDIPGSTVLVLGAGPLGLTACAMARESGACEVWCCDLDAGRAARALTFGATRALSTDELPAATLARGVDAVVEFTGSSDAVACGIAALRTGGTAILAGTVLPSPAVPLDPERVVRHMLTIRGLHNYAPADLVAAVRFLDVAQYLYPLASLIAGTFPLESINEAFLAADSRPGFRVAVVPKSA